MSEKPAGLEKLLTEAMLVLNETEHNLQRLAQQAMLEYQQLTAYGGSEDAPSVTAPVRIQQIGQQLSKLSERSKVLKSYLQDGLDTPPLDDDQWSRIKILQSQEEERAQLARELEDSVGQLLANAVFELASCRHLLENDDQAVFEGLDGLQRELEHGLANVRRFIVDLEPATILGNFGLAEGVRRYLGRFEVRTKIESKLHVKTNIGRLPSIIETTIFRVIQEALLNIERHANATQVVIVFQEGSNHFEFNVTDNGNGFMLDRVVASKKNLGLARMVDYAELLNGKLKILSEPQLGTQVILFVPYHTV